MILSVLALSPCPDSHVAAGPYLRAVTHRDVADAHVAAALGTIRALATQVT